MATRAEFEFSLPGQVEDLDDSVEQAALARVWQGIVDREFSAVADRSQFYDPSKRETPADADVHDVTWRAFPATVNHLETTAVGRWLRADKRQHQDEYCEWSVERDGDKVKRITFTTELPEYYEALWEVDREEVLGLYRRHVSEDVQIDELRRQDGGYDRDNVWNTAANGPIMHLRNGPNNLHAAVALAANATVSRVRDGMPVTKQQDLMDCGDLGIAERNSDPQIASAINGLAALGRMITLTDPLGLYINELRTDDISLPAGVAIEDCWTIERGVAGLAVRASFALPDAAGTVSDVTLQGVGIAFGAQLADRVRVRIRAFSDSPRSVTPIPKECEG
jgi:hypothetical protein